MTGAKLKSRLTSYRQTRDTLTGLSLAMLFVATVTLASATAFLLFSAWPYVVLIVPLTLTAFWLTRRPSVYDIARSAELRDLSWHDRLSTAADLSAKRNPREVYSDELSGDYIGLIENRLNGKKLSTQKERRNFFYSLGIAATAVIAIIAISVALPARMRFGFNAVFAPGRLDLRIESLTPDTLLEKGASAEVAARITAPVKLGFVYLEKIEDKRISRSRVNVRNDIANVRLNLTDETKFRFSRLGRSSEEVYIGINQPFDVTNIAFTTTPPPYTGEKPRLSSGLSFSALPGSAVSFAGSASAELESAVLKMGDSEVKLDVDGRDFRGSFEYTRQASVSVSLKSRTGMSVERKIGIDARTDQVPLVYVFTPGKDAEVDKSMELTIGVELADDYGLGQAALVAQGPGGQRIPIGSSKGRVEDTLFYLWDLSSLNLLPGDEITYYVEASDNDPVLGPKWGRSKIYRIRLPGIDEAFSQVTKYGTQAQGELSTLGERQQELGAELSRIESKLKSQRDLSSEEKARLEEIIEAQKNLMGSVDSLAHETRKFLEKLQENAITDPETAAKLASLSQMLSNLMPPELRSKLEDLAEALKNDPNRLAEELNKTSSLSRDLENQLEQAMAVLERFLEEQSLSELAEKAEALAEMEDNLVKESSKLSPEEAQAKQKEIEKGLEELAKSARELSENLPENQMSEELSELARQMSVDNLNLSQKIEKSLSKSIVDKESARKLSKNLKQASMQFGQMASNLKRSRQDQLNKEMALAARELLLLSEEQEKLLDNLEATPSLEAAAKAAELERSLERSKENLYQLASQSFRVPRDAMQNLADASRNEAEFKENLIEGRIPSAQDQGKSAQSSIDKAAASLLDAYARGSGQSGNSSTGLEEMLNALSQMSLAQLSLNQQMSGLFPLPISGQMTAAQQAALGELLSEQSGLRRELEELSKGAGQEPGLSDMLEGIIEEMKRMEEDMSRYVGQRELVDRGEQVFRRLLDARNVLRKKDETREREREIGSVWNGLPSPALPVDAGERDLWLKRELIKIERSDYPESYKHLARTYIESLLEKY